MRVSQLLFSLFFLPALLSGQSGTYNFDHKVKVMISHSSPEFPAGALDYAFLFSDSEPVIGLIGKITQAGMSMETQAVFDSKSGFALMLIDQAGMKMGMKMNVQMESNGEVAEKAENVKVRKTGNTKKILGYDCEEYEVVDEKAYGLIWVTKDLDLPNFYDAFAAVNRQPAESSMTIPDGFMMLMTVWPEGKEAEDKMVIEVTEILKDTPSEISTEGYQIMDMPNR